MLDSFFEASEIDKAIAKQQVSIEAGVPVLRRFIKDYVREDIKLLDSATYDVLMEQVDQLNKRNAEVKQRLDDRIIADDEIDERNLKLKKLQTDHERWHQELVNIQTIMCNKQWFDVDV